jgi:hypothetical protein
MRVAHKSIWRVRNAGRSVAVSRYFCLKGVAMPVELPSTHLFYHPILKYLSTADGPVQRQVVIDAVADLLELNEEQRSRLANDQTPSHAYRSGWSLSVLKKAGLLANPSRGYWSLQDKGRRILEKHPDRLYQDTIAWINAFWWSKKEEAEVRIIAGTGQGLGLTAIERKAVEDHAMLKAKAYLASQGWSCEDTSKNRPYDYLAERKGETIIVEVKGTTSKEPSILLTANEVKAQREQHPHNALIIVHSIVLNRRSKPPTASGGLVRPIIPWLVVEEHLVPRTFHYRLADEEEE